MRFEEHVRHLNVLFRCLITNGLNINLDKTNFAQRRVTFLVRISSGDGVERYMKQIDALLRILCQDNHKGWYDTLEAVPNALNNKWRDSGREAIREKGKTSVIRSYS